MEKAIECIVTTFLSSAKGGDNLSSSAFQKLVKKQFSGIMEVRNQTLSYSSSLFAFLMNPTWFNSVLIICKITTNNSWSWLSLPVFRTRTPPQPSKRCSVGWMRTMTEKSASRNISIWLATLPLLTVSERLLQTRTIARCSRTCSDGFFNK